MSDLSNTLIVQFDYWKPTLQILVIVGLVFWIYYRIRKTNASKIVNGIVVILALYFITRLLSLDILSWILGVLVQLSVIGFIIIFQPELRQFLIYLGRRDSFIKNFFLHRHPATFNEKLIKELVESAQLLSKDKTGALMVLRSSDELGDSFFTGGTRIDAEVTTELLMTLFYPKTPLHDGAVVISKDGRIVSAGVVLPLSGSDLKWHYGTRHRAAIGLTEKTPDYCLVISEETGDISMVYRGNIEKMTGTDDLRHHLEYLYSGNTGPVSDNRRYSIDSISTFFQWFQRHLT